MLNFFIFPRTPVRFVYTRHQRSSLMLIPFVDVNRAVYANCLKLSSLLKDAPLPLDALVYIYLICKKERHAGNHPASHIPVGKLQVSLRTVRRLNVPELPIEHIIRNQGTESLLNMLNCA